MSLIRKEQLDELVEIAASRLEEYKTRVDHADFLKALAVVMGEIARDFGFKLDQRLVPSGEIGLTEVHEPQDLVAIEEKERPVHLACFLADINQFRQALLTLGNTRRVISMFFFVLNDDVRSLAQSLNTNPVFVARDSEDALSLLREFYLNNFSILTTAINGEQVILHCIEANQS